MLEALPHRQILAGLACLLLSCSTQIDGGQTVCTDPATGQFEACPGVSVCVDPLKGTVIPCVSGDVTFGKADSDAGSKSDGDASDAPGDSAVDAPIDAVKDVPIADVPPSDVPQVDSGVCQTGAKQCKDKATLQTCNKGTWGGDVTCPTTQECNDGACGCPSPCKALGLVECLPDVPAIKTCQMNPDKCLSWGVPIACKPGEICQNGQCKTGTAGGCNPPCSSNQTCQGTTCVNNTTGGSLTCGQIVACNGNCASGDTACSDGCVTQGSGNAQNQFTAYKGCISAICKGFVDAGKVNDAMACIFNNCFDVQSACVGSGSATCSATNTCMSSCSGAAPCVDNCNKSASKTGGLGYYTLQGCIDANCAGQSGDSLIDCAKTQCTSGFVGCFSPIGAGAILSSCLQIATCEAKCASSDVLCAKACKAQGTAQAQADVDAFVTCRDSQCALYCPGSNCTLCLAQYCPNETDACSQ